jgi:hypothetical protein
MISKTLQSTDDELQLSIDPIRDAEFEATVLFPV